MSPVGSMGTQGFADYPCDYLSEGSDEAEAAPKTPKAKKTILPEDYDATSGRTPPGWEGTWRETNARCGTDRPLVPGRTSSPRIPPGPFFVDTPPSTPSSK